MKVHNFEQGTEEWHDMRLGKLTGSDFHIFFGSSSTKQSKIEQLAAERILKLKSDSKKISNIHIERGHDLEPDACSIYELINNVIVKNVGFIELDEFAGCSPDGLIGDDGMIEIKSKDNHTFIKQVIKGLDGIEPTYKTQIQFNLFATDRKWCDYICYNPNFSHSTYIERIYIDDERLVGKKGFYTVSQIKEKIKEINNEVNAIIENFNVKIKMEIKKHAC